METAMKGYVITVFVTFLYLLAKVDSKELCEKKLLNCTGMMKPVLNEVRYMFPTTQTEIEGMCKVWSHIMDCVRKYVTDCSSEEQRSKFNDAVSNSIDSVHAICSSERYRRDYLEYASCFRQVSMENCGNHFKKMVDSAYDPRSPEIYICCAYRQYEKCVSDPIQRICGSQALHILDDSMSSLRSRCEAVSSPYKSMDKICPSDIGFQDTHEYKQARPSLRHVEQTYSPLSTSAFLLNSRANPHTTPSWAPRTVIYPLPVTRHSRISRSAGTSLQSSRWPLLVTFAIAGALIGV